MECLELRQEMDRVLEDVPESRHSYFQLKHFVIGKEPTIQSKMWQCLRELQSRKNTIDSLNLSIEETKDQLELVEIDQVKELNSISKADIYPAALREREKIIKCRQFERKRQSMQQSLAQMEENLKFAWEEAKFFLQTFTAINKIEPLKNYDDLEAQKEYWNERITQQINLKLLLQQPLDIELVQTALSLHDDAPIRIQTQNTLHHIEGQMNKLKDQYLHKIGTKDNNGETQSNEFR